MRRINSMMLTGYFLLVAITASSQVAGSLNRASAIEPQRLEISNSKTTNIIFPFAIISVDRGSKEVLTQKASGVENILQVKAASDTFSETNLTVVTADGKLNSFLLNFARQPAVLNYSLGPKTPEKGNISMAPEHINQAEVRAYAQAAGSQKKGVKGISDEKFDILLEMTGFYIHNDIMYCRIEITNYSNIGYDIDQLRFFIRDQKKAKRTASQEIEITPVHVEGGTDKVPGMIGWHMVYAMPKFTIPDQKYLAIQLMEKNGGRHLNLKVKNKTIIKARMLTAPGYESIINL